MDANRFNVICQLIELSAPLADIAMPLHALEWDYDGKPLRLNSDHLTSVLQRYLDDCLSSEEVARWADLIEMRDDIEIDSHIKGHMHELANPFLMGNLTKSRAQYLLISSKSRSDVKDQ